MNFGLQIATTNGRPWYRLPLGYHWGLPRSHQTLGEKVERKCQRQKPQTMCDIDLHVMQLYINLLLMNELMVQNFVITMHFQQDPIIFRATLPSVLLMSPSALNWQLAISCASGINVDPSVLGGSNEASVQLMKIWDKHQKTKPDVFWIKVCNDSLNAYVKMGKTKKHLFGPQHHGSQPFPPHGWRLATSHGGRWRWVPIISW